MSAKVTRPKETAASRWISYRPDIRVLDCTIRDGGLMNNHHFDDQTVKAVYEACVAAGIDYMELGYTGLLNQHPRAAIKFKEAEIKGEKGDILKFYDTVTE